MIDDDEDELATRAHGARRAPRRQATDPAGAIRARIAAAEVLLPHERLATTQNDRVLTIMRLMTIGRWKRVTARALAHRTCWNCARATVSAYAAEASRRLRARDDDLLDQRHMIASQLFSAAMKASGEPLPVQVKIQAEVIRATAPMFETRTAVTVRLDPVLEGFDESELVHFAEVSPEACKLEGCRIHAPEVMARMLGRTT